ncbi:MAG: hypothetical protein II893_04370 [Methanomicrobium sp.]|nr:hypothetical protein [Methanomicrobium sp.]
MYKSVYKSAIFAVFIGLILMLLMMDPVDALSANATDEQLRIMNELEGSDMTIGEYMQKVWPEFYAEMSDEQKEHINRWKRSWPKDANTIKNNEVKWHSQNVSSFTTALGIKLCWGESVNPDYRRNVTESAAESNTFSNLSITVYSPTGLIFGPYRDADFDRSQNGIINFYIKRLNGVDLGEWWYAVKGDSVDGTEYYTV